MKIIKNLSNLIYRCFSYFCHGDQCTDTHNDQYGMLLSNERWSKEKELAKHSEAKCASHALLHDQLYLQDFDDGTHFCHLSYVGPFHTIYVEFQLH